MSVQTQPESLGDGGIPPALRNHDRWGGSVTIVTTLLAAIGGLLLGLRVYTKVYITNGISVDDALLMLAMVGRDCTLLND